MPRKLRMEYPGAMYHVMSRGDRCGSISSMTWTDRTSSRRWPRHARRLAGIRLNHRHRLFGHVSSGRYKAQLVEGSGNGYLRTACDYVYLNPARSGILKAEERLLA
jgi:hypothetical protein